MKYALIAMIAVYLVTFGCSPEAPEEHEKPVHSSAETAVPNENQTVIHEVQQVEVQTTAHTTETKPAEPVVTPAAEAEVVAEIDVLPETTPEAQNQWEAIAQSATATVLALMAEDSEEIAVKTPEAPVTVVLETAETKLPCGKAQATASHHKKAPCGKFLPKNEAAAPPCLRHKPQAEESGAPELDAAMQKMVDATNDMIVVTRQLAKATQQMLSASKSVAIEVIDTGKEILEAQKKTQPAEQTADANAPVEKALNDVVATVKDVVSATKEVIEATSEALSTAVDKEEKQ